MPEAVVSTSARQDLLEIWEFIARDNLNAADRVLKTVFGMFERLAAMPELGTRLELGNPHLKSIRFLPVPGFPHYLIFYRPIGKLGVEIVRVLHGTRDIGALLGDPL